MTWRCPVRSLRRSSPLPFDCDAWARAQWAAFDAARVAHPGVEFDCLVHYLRRSAATFSNQPGRAELLQRLVVGMGECRCGRRDDDDPPRPMALAPGSLLP